MQRPGWASQENGQHLAVWNFKTLITAVNNMIYQMTCFVPVGGWNNIKNKACTSTEHGYAMRYPCHNASRPCNHRCKCKYCQNKLGNTSKPVDSTPKPKRVRMHYSNQEHDLKGQKGQEFMQQVGESAKMGPSSDFEFLLAASILRDSWVAVRISPKNGVHIILKM